MNGIVKFVFPNRELEGTHSRFLPLVSRISVEQMKSEKQAFPVPRSQSPCSFAPLILLVAIELVIYIVTTGLVLLPVLLPNLGISGGHSHHSYVTIAIGVLLLVTYQVLFILLCVSAFCTVTTPPGDIPSWLRSDGKSDLHSYSNLLQAVERKRDGSPRFCRKTMAYKPDRAHYCAEVGRCVLQYQTFSVSLNSAIGFYNYKYYLLTVFYGFCTSAWVVGACLPDVMDSWPPFSRLPDSSPPPSVAAAVPLPIGARSLLDMGAADLQRRIEFGVNALVFPSVVDDDETSQYIVDATMLFTLVAAVLLLIPCLVLCVLHGYLIMRGYTLYEWRQVLDGKRAKGISLFDYGGLHNVALTLGVYPTLWLLPTRSGIEGNGIFFPEQERMQ